MRFLDQFSHAGSCEARAHALRDIVKVLCPVDKMVECDDWDAADPNEATRRLLGLTPGTLKQSRAWRRQRAADTMAMPIDTFRKRYELRLLRDVAHELWMLEADAMRTHRWS